MKRLATLLLLAVVSLSTNVSAAGNAKKIANGKFLYEDWGCKGCHGIGAKYNQEAEKGPNLAGVFVRRKADWIKKFTKNPEAMITAGDKDAVEMNTKYGKIMKTFKISDAEWDDIFEFIKSEGGNK